MDQRSQGCGLALPAALVVRRSHATLGQSRWRTDRVRLTPDLHRSPRAVHRPGADRPAPMRLLVAMHLGEPEVARRCRFGIELDEYRCLVTDDPGVVSGLNDHDLRRDELEGAAVSVLATYVAPSQEADVRVHAMHCADERLEVC